MKLFDQDITTKEVLGWKGVHLFHFMPSSCSQKLRIFLNLKKIDWQSHLIDLSKSEQFSPWYLGINPRGLVPTLVMNGEVHIESNDIIETLEQEFPENPLIPKGYESQMTDLLHHEDQLHLDLRVITYRFTQSRGKTPRSAEDLKNYREGGTGTVQGKKDLDKEREIQFWESFTEKGGVTDEAIQLSAARFREAFEGLDQKLANHSYLFSDVLSVLDIAWFIYVNRLARCGYPLERLHPRLYAWFLPLRDHPEFAKEITVPPEVQKAVEENHRQQKASGTTLIDIAGL